MPRSKAANGKNVVKTTESGWRAIRWEDLEDWAGKKTLDRGKKYQQERRVKDLAVTNDGGLLATVTGTEEYAVHVWLEGKSDRRRPESMCSCPVGYACKHAVATIVEYLHALAGRRETPKAADDDPRWYDLDDAGAGDEYGSRPAHPRGASKDWDERIRANLRSMSSSELVETLWSLAQAVPEVYSALRERTSLRDLSPAELVGETRREIKTATSVIPWRNHWDDEGELPDYRPVEHLLRRLLELGRADDVVTLGRDLVKKSRRQVEQADDEGETVDRLHRVLAVVFEGVAKSSLPGPERLLFAIDAILAESMEVVDDAADVVLDAAEPTDWGAVADVLSARLKALPAPSRGDYQGRSQRQRLADWIAEALEYAGRAGELPALLESEARATGERRPLIDHLIEAGRLEDAEREIREALSGANDPTSGDTTHLMDSLDELAVRRKQWDVVAAHAARKFFIHPSVDRFKALLKAAKKAKVEPTVRAAALEFLRTGRAPYAWVKAKPASKSRGGKSAAARTGEPAHLETDPSWPLPVPDEVVAQLRRSIDQTAAFPRPGLLIEIALDERDAARALEIYESMASAASKSPLQKMESSRYADRVAEAAAATHPDRALPIYLSELERSLPIADPEAYDRSARLLARLRPIYSALNRSEEWKNLVESARETYRNRPRFLERLKHEFGRP